jgi:hypothetical protein
MGSDDIFKKRRADREKRKHDFKQPKANSFLIVTEGEKTEPLYLNGLKDLILDKIGGNIKVIELPHIEIKGEGKSTGKLIEKTNEIISKSSIIYQNVWIVFDKDDFLDFDQAIKSAKDQGYNVAWSNQCFEYWIYLHFHYSDAALHRYDWNSKLDELFKQYNLNSGKYDKNLEQLYNMLDSFGGVDTAIKHARRRMSKFKNDKGSPSTFDPGTTVFLLVETLREYLV